jgi:hypothetical protein
MSIVTTVSETEAKVVAVVRDLQDTVVEYVQKGVDYVQSGTFAEHVQKGGDLATERLAKVGYPDKLPAPSEVVDAVSGFVTSVVGSATEAVAPLVGRPAKPEPADEAPADEAPADEAPATKAAPATKSAKATKATKAAKATKTTRATKTTKSD